MGLFKRQVVAQGRIGRIGELREFGENAVISFSIAETQRVKDKDGNWTDGDTIWTNVDVWGKEAHMFKKSDFKPGDTVVVVGTTKVTSSEKDGETRTFESVVAQIVGAALTPWTYIEKIGNVSDGGKSTTKKSHAQKEAEAKKAEPKEDLSLDIPEDDLFDTGDDLFGDMGADDEDNLFDF